MIPYEFCVFESQNVVVHYVSCYLLFLSYVSFWVVGNSGEDIKESYMFLLDFVEVGTYYTSFMMLTRKRLSELNRQLADEQEKDELLKAQMQMHFENIQRISVYNDIAALHALFK
ncbi:hypothetical protein R6Q59_020333 [Mikania micrantha]